MNAYKPIEIPPGMNDIPCNEMLNSVMTRNCGKRLLSGEMHTKMPVENATHESGWRGEEYMNRLWELIYKTFKKGNK